MTPMLPGAPAPAACCESKMMPETAGEIAQHADVREALDQTQGKKVKAQAKDKVSFVSYALLVLISVGFISVIVGLSVQTPMSSFIGWIHILVRRTYRAGDRIKIGAATGDVIDISYIDTTLWEFGGQYISGDHPRGRIIKFPNAKVLDSMVYNYSWPLFPYIWNEIKFHIGYESDLAFIAETMQRITEEELGEAILERVGQYRELLAHTPVDELEVREH